MDCGDGCVDANVAIPVDDVANVSPIGMDWAGGCVDANVANPVDDVANASPIAMDSPGGQANGSPIGVDWADGCIQDWLAFSRPKPVFTVQNRINWD